MEKIALPKKIEFKKSEKLNQGIINIGPCFPGYGITIGNSLRRVLLSSLPGAAVVGVKIKGVDHEFMTLTHIKEDVLELILNLKQLRVKVLSKEEEIKLVLDVHGKKNVKASDITKNPNVEVINKDLELATITDMAGSLNMEIIVKKGRGFKAVEAIEEKRNEIGFIEMDAVFSPVISVGINNHNVRVGDKTDWDQLELDVVTDGTITLEEAFNQSIKILTDQFNALVGEKEKEDDKKDDEKLSGAKSSSDDKKKKEDKKDTKK